MIASLVAWLQQHHIQPSTIYTIHNMLYSVFIMSELPADGTDRVTTEIKGYLVDTITGVRPLSRDFSRGLTFGQNIQLNSGAEGGLLETILVRMEANAPQESDLFYLGAVLGGIASREVQRP